MSVASCLPRVCRAFAQTVHNWLDNSGDALARWVVSSLVEEPSVAHYFFENYKWHIRKPNISAGQRCLPAVHSRLEKQQQFVVNQMIRSQRTLFIASSKFRHQVVLTSQRADIQHWHNVQPAEEGKVGVFTSLSENTLTDCFSIIISVLSACFLCPHDGLILQLFFFFCRFLCFHVTPPGFVPFPSPWSENPD